MMAREFCGIAQRLMNCPAAPYYEHAVAEQVKAICAETRLTCKADEFGNVIASNGPTRSGRPLILAAHMDHPGFEVIQRTDQKHLLAWFNGGVGDKYFRRGVRVRVMPGAIPAQLGRGTGKGREFELQIAPAHRGPVSQSERGKVQPRFAVWELVDFEMRNGQIHGRACDDLIGVAAILATLIESKRRRIATQVIGIISRAEEVGFQGALAVAAAGKIRRNSIVVSLETSREMPSVKMGSGVIIRVGDRTSIFDSQATRYLTEVAGAIKGDFHFQRALMSGGTCEATAYQEFGCQTCAVCVALGNYHNCAPNNQIRAEYVSIADALSMVRLLAEAARQMPAFEKLTNRLPQRLHKLLREGKQRLKRLPL